MVHSLSLLCLTSLWGTNSLGIKVANRLPRGYWLTISILIGWLFATSYPSQPDWCLMDGLPHILRLHDTDVTNDTRLGITSQNILRLATSTKSTLIDYSQKDLIILRLWYALPRILQIFNRLENWCHCLILFIVFERAEYKLTVPFRITGRLIWVEKRIAPYWSHALEEHAWLSTLNTVRCTRARFSASP